jgi:hypothetical protein
MMNLRLNLLSPDKKKNFVVVVRYLFVKEMLELAIFTVAILAMMYLFAWWIITQAMSDAVSSALLVNRDVPPINREIQDLNRKTKNVVLSAQDFTMLTPKIVEFAAKLPPDIKLAGFEIDRKTNTITFSGTAATRDALLGFQKFLSELTWLQGATAPTAQLFQKENINFEIRGSLKGSTPLKKK